MWLVIKGINAFTVQLEMEMPYQLAFGHAPLAFPGIISKLNPSATCAPPPRSFALQLSEFTDTELWCPSGMSNGYWRDSVHLQILERKISCLLYHKGYYEEKARW